MEVHLLEPGRPFSPDKPCLMAASLPGGAVAWPWSPEGPGLEDVLDRLLPPPLQSRENGWQFYQWLNGKVQAPDDDSTLRFLLENCAPQAPYLSYCLNTEREVRTHNLGPALVEARHDVWTRMAELYDLILARTPPFQDLIRRYCRDLKGCARILEAGAGSGLIAQALAVQGSELHAIDRNTKMVSLARHKGTFQAGAGDVEELFFPDEYFDGYLSNNVVLFTRLEKTLSEAWRVLRPGGLLAISSAQVVPDLRLLGGVVERMTSLGISESQARAFLELQTEMLPSTRPESGDRVKAILTQLGFRVLKEEEAYAGVNFYLVAQK